MTDRSIHRYRFINNMHIGYNYNMLQAKNSTCDKMLHTSDFITDWGLTVSLTGVNRKKYDILARIPVTHRIWLNNAIGTALVDIEDTSFPFNCGHRIFEHEIFESWRTNNGIKSDHGLHFINTNGVDI